MLYHIRATNGLSVPFSSTWRRTTLTRSNWCRASRTWSSRSWYSRNIFLISCRSPRSYKYSIFFNFVNILSITCRRSSALSFRWTQPARCLSHIGTHQTLQFCILYFVFCICICSACKAKNQDGAPRPTSAWPMSSLRANAVLYYVLYYVYYVLYICTLGHIGLTAVRASALNI